MAFTYTDTCELMESCGEPITHLAAAGSDESFRTLIAATRTAIYSSNDYTGNWRILADGLGGGHDEEQCNTCSNRRFKSAQLGNYILFTNNFDPVLAWKYGDEPTGLNLWSAQYVEDLLVVGITKARCVAEFNGFIFVGNVDIEGQHKGSRVYWSDYNAPLSWIPHDQSLASYQEFGLGEKVLRIEPLGKFLIVYTDKALYQGIFVGGDQVFQFNPIPTDSPLVYEHTLVNTGKAHIYVSHNGIYTVTASDLRPSRYEWMHKASGAVFSGIGDDILAGFVGLDSFDSVNQEQCDQFVGGYNGITEEIWFSWPTGDENCPTKSLVLNLRYNAADLVDHGFTAFVNYKPDYRPNVRDWLDSEGVCPSSVSDFVKEGAPLDDYTGDTPSYLWNPDEDPTLPIHEDSWCAQLNGTTVDDLCDDCDSSPVFLMADAADFTIKEYHDETFYREVYDPETGLYSNSGYYTLLQSDQSKLGLDEEKIIKQVVADYQAASQEPPSELTCEVAYSSQPRCTTWKDIGDKELTCLTDYSAAQHLANNTRPTPDAKFNAFYRGHFLGYRIYTSGVGGSACFSRITLSVSKAAARNH
jgi:hypothetical protein